MAKKQTKNRREFPNFTNIRKLQRLCKLSEKELAIAAGYGGDDPAHNFRTAERNGYWQKGNSNRLCLVLGWDINEILPTTQNANSETPLENALDKENPPCDCISSVQSAMFLGQINNQMLVLNHMLYKLCEALDVKLKIKVGDFNTEERSVS